jgi:hypothetical protein
MTNGGAKAIAGMMDSLVAGGMHPASVALAELDSEPEVLWAGGMPYSIRDSLAGPAFAQIDPATPHLHTAGVMPETRPTPLWDAFLAAVWPDEELRRWAVRVLSIAVTGYADRALPILLGETGRGKTQVIHLLMSVLGTYGHAANPKLLSPATNEHDTIVFDLKGRRLSFIDEAPGRQGRPGAAQAALRRRVAHRAPDEPGPDHLPAHPHAGADGERRADPGRPGRPGPRAAHPLRGRPRAGPAGPRGDRARLRRSVAGRGPRCAGRDDGRGGRLDGRPGHRRAWVPHRRRSGTWPSTWAPSRTRSVSGSPRRPSPSSRAPRAASSTRPSRPPACATTPAATRSPARPSGAVSSAGWATRASTRSTASGGS